MKDEQIAREIVEACRHEDWDDTEGRLPDYWEPYELVRAIAAALATALREGFDACKEQAARRLNAAAAEAVEDQLPHCEVIALALREAAEDILRREPNT